MKHVLKGVLTLLLAASPALADRTVSKTLPLAADGKVTIDTYKGSIRVTPWDRAEVAVEARIVADDSCGSERDQKKWMDGDGGRHRAERPGRADRVRLRRARGELGLSPGLHEPPVRPLPDQPAAHGALKIHDYKSDTDVKDFAGHLTLETYKGSAALVGLSGALDLKTYKGDVRAGFDAPLGRRARRDLQGRRVPDVPGRVGASS